MQKIEKIIFIPSHDKTPLEVRLSYWKDELGRIVNGDSGTDKSNKNINIYNSRIRNSSIGIGNSGGRTSWSGEPECGDYKSIAECLINSGRIRNETIIELPKILELIIVLSLILLFIYGNYDQFTRSGRFKNWIRENNLINNPRWTIKELRGVDHFYVTSSMGNSLTQELNEWNSNNSYNAESSNNESNVYN
ncbi:8757_t:CDS:2 [Diversispora eburnea]|uniref:8757_t:CDS:1 n=1 Tax=Diversispora eburnea TaxID=1213867 RepID=A0A9N8Z9K7_9GLOM|nr:8757_t:CDS:2 [Diversispora eburnea]